MMLVENNPDWTRSFFARLIAFLGAPPLAYASIGAFLLQPLLGGAKQELVLISATISNAFFLDFANNLPFPLLVAKANRECLALRPNGNLHCRLTLALLDFSDRDISMGAHISLPDANKGLESTFRALWTVNRQSDCNGRLVTAVVLFLAQHAHWIEASRASRWNPASKHGNTEEQYRNCRKAANVDCMHTVQCGLHQTCKRQCACQPNCCPNNRQSHGVARHQRIFALNDTQPLQNAGYPQACDHMRTSLRGVNTGAEIISA